MKRLTIIIKPTELCNCSCTYCITPKEIPHTRMNIQTIKQLCEKLKKSTIYDNFCFIWHGGEPMMMGVEFYEKAIAIQKDVLGDLMFINTFQSNCTLIDENWIEFLKKYKIKVSTSLDGDEDLHNINRLKNGKGTYQETINNIKKLQSEKLLAGVVTVLSKTNINYIDRIINSFSRLNINPRLNPILPCERVDEKEDLSISVEEYADGLISCFDSWVDGKYNNSENISIAPLNEIIYNFTHEGIPRLCNFSGSCGEHFIAINPEGDLFNCGRFCDIEKFKIENINNIHNIDDIIIRKKDLIKWDIPKEESECNNCEWYRYCNRGCPNSSYLFSGEIKEKDPYCQAYKKIFSHIYSCLNKAIHE